MGKLANGADVKPRRSGGARVRVVRARAGGAAPARMRHATARVRAGAGGWAARARGRIARGFGALATAGGPAERAPRAHVDHPLCRAGALERRKRMVKTGPPVLAPKIHPLGGWRSPFSIQTPWAPSTLDPHAAHTLRGRLKAPALGCGSTEARDGERPLASRARRMAKPATSTKS